MKPKIIHQEAMELSFKAKQCLESDNYIEAYEIYQKAALLESQVAEFYFDKPELEPTRSVIIRSAAFLNLKAGLIESAKKFIFFGLLNITDEIIKSQLNDALEIMVSLRNLEREEASRQYNYIAMLRQRSAQYVLEPIDEYTFGRSISLEMMKDFAENYLKSLKAFAVAKYKRIATLAEDIEDAAFKELLKIINPLITRSAYGSFKFSIANDFVKRPGESRELVKLKSNVIHNFHYEIFANLLKPEDISEIKEEYTEEEINEMFRPLFKIKSTNTPYKIGYFDSENLNKTYIARIVNEQRKKLITVRQITQADIGELENSIVHSRIFGGKLSKKTILKKHLKSLEFDFPTREITPSLKPPIILNNEILLSINFSSDTGFAISFDDFSIEYQSIEFEKALAGFYNSFYEKIKRIITKQIEERTEQENRDYMFMNKYIENPEALK